MRGLPHTKRERGLRLVHTFKLVISGSPGVKGMALLKYC